MRTQAQRSTIDIASELAQRPIMSESSVRSARPNDVSRILELIRGIAAYEKLTHQLEIDEDRTTCWQYCCTIFMCYFIIITFVTTIIWMMFCMIIVVIIIIVSIFLLHGFYY